MLTVNIHDAKTRLSKLIARAVAGEPFVIAKAGKPMVTVTAFDAPQPKKVRRIGFAVGRWTIPDDGFPENVSQAEQEELERLWYEGPIFPPEATEKPAGDNGR